MGITPEQFDALLKALGTQNGSQSAILVFCGVTAVTGIILIMWFLLNIRLAPFGKMEKRLDELQNTLNDMNAKLISQDTINLLIDNRILACMRSHDLSSKQKNGAPLT